MSLIYGEYLVNVHFSDIPHTFIPQFTLHSAEKNPHQIFRKLPVDNFPHSAIRIPQNTPSLAATKNCLIADLPLALCFTNREITSNLLHRVPRATYRSECIRLSPVSFRVLTKIIFKVAIKLFIFHDVE